VEGKKQGKFTKHSTLERTVREMRSEVAQSIPARRREEKLLFFISSQCYLTKTPLEPRTARD